MQNSVDQLFGAPLTNVASIRINHCRDRIFRKRSIIELPFHLFGVIIGGILMVILFFRFFDLGNLFDSNGGDGGGSYDSSDRKQTNPVAQNPNFKKNRFYSFFHLFRISFHKADGSILYQASYKPLNDRDAFDTISRLLDMAKKEKLVVVENLFFGIERRLTTWYGGLPLLTAPRWTNMEALLNMFKSEGYEIVKEKESLSLIHKKEKQGIFAAVILIPIYTVLLIIPYFLVQPEYRILWLNHIFDLFKFPEAEERITITAQDIVYSYTRKGIKLRRSLKASGRTIQAFRFHPSLGYKGNVDYIDPRLEIRTDGGPIFIPDSFYGKYGLQMADLLHLATVSFRAQSTDFHEEIEQKHPVKCPYCGAVFIVEESQNCTSCGAYPTAF